MQNFSKFKYLTLDPLGGVKGGGVKLPCLSTGTWQSWFITALMKCEDHHTKKKIGFALQLPILKQGQ